LPYSVQAQFDGPALQLALPQHAAATSIGESVALSVSLQDAGHPVAQATVKAHVRRPDNHIDTLVMLDDGQWPDAGAGDGVYTVLVADNSLAGYQPVLFTASGTRTNGASFSRQQFGLISVAAGKARLTGTHSDSGIDSDGDWLFNHLQFKVGVRADVAGNYRVYAELIDSAGHRYPASKTVSLATGDSDIDLAFDGNALYAAHVDGPYQLAVLRLSESTPAGVLPTDQLSVPEASHPYAYTDFQHAAIEIPGESSSVGADSNGNGQFDELVFRLKADIAQAGFYEWTGVLVDADGNELGFASGSGNLAAGSNWLELHFDGSAIGAAGINGPYYVRDILISGMDTGQVVDQVWPTEPFDASEFEGFVMAPVASAVSVPSTAWWGLLLLAGLLGWLGQTRLRGNTIH
ncbi:MAG TPA: choice-of-anchor X domain-containing protein, partial [Rhodanobacteraceae bacterium]|nr:choice-of-anchor X domain-containing protein [Rhodanobacteraceae bacterium]